jgi:hypothetical protein
MGTMSFGRLVLRCQFSIDLSAAKGEAETIYNAHCLQRHSVPINAEANKLLSEVCLTFNGCELGALLRSRQQGAK